MVSSETAPLNRKGDDDKYTQQLTSLDSLWNYSDTDKTTSIRDKGTVTNDKFRTIVGSAWVIRILGVSLLLTVYILLPCQKHRQKFFSEFAPKRDHPVHADDRFDSGIISRNHYSTDIDKKENDDWVPNVIFGNYTMAITFDSDTTSTNAIQNMFDVALMECYGFAFFEARKTTTQLLSRYGNGSSDFYCPMCHWLLAMGYSPYINHPIIPNESDYKAAGLAASTAFDEANKDKSHRRSLSIKEIGLVDAMNLRFHASFENQTIGYESYSERLDDLHHDMVKSGEKDADIMGFLADSIMILHSDNDGYHFYDEIDNQTPKPRIRYAISLLEDCLALRPDHPLCQHLYIHITEPSSNILRLKAGGVADRLSKGSLRSDAQHLQHMPSHTYLRIGRYHDAVVSNVVAHDSDERYSDHSFIAYGPAHNMAFLVHAAQLSGECRTAYQYANALRNHYRQDPSKPDGPGIEERWHIWRTVRLRFGQYTSILEDNDDVPMNGNEITRKGYPSLAAGEKGSSWPYAIVLGHYSKGIASLWNTTESHTDSYNIRLADAMQHLKSLRETVPNVDSSYFGMVAVADWTLDASIQYYIQKRLPEPDYGRALELFQRARTEQENWVYTEPPSWYTTVALCEGTLLRIMGRHQESVEAFQDDLKLIPENLYGLYGLKMAMLASGTATSSEIKAVADRFVAASSWSDPEVQEIPPLVCPELGE